MTHNSFAHDYSGESIFVESESYTNKGKENRDAVQEWAAAWDEYFRLDETRDDAEIQTLCKRLRALASSHES